MEVEKINVLNEDKAAILKKAVENGKAEKEVTNLFNALNFENSNTISENDFAAFNMFKDKEEKLSLTDEKLKALKLFDINNDGTFSDSEFNLLELTNYLGGTSFLLGANILDVDKDGKFSKDEINMLAKILKKYAKSKDKKLKEEKDFFNLYGNPPLQFAIINFDKTKEILDKINNKELLEKVLLTKDLRGETPFHNANIKVTKLILDKIGNDKELLEKILFAENGIGYTPLEWFCFEEKTRLILEKIDDKELLEKVLLKTDEYGNTLLNSANAEKTAIILDKIGDNTNLLKKVLLVKTKFGITPLHNADIDKTKMILNKIAEIENKNEAKALLEKLLKEKNSSGNSLYDITKYDKRELLKTFAEKYDIDLEK